MTPDRLREIEVFVQRAYEDFCGEILPLVNQTEQIPVLPDDLQQVLDLVRWANRPDAVAMTTDGVNALLDRIHELRSALAELLGAVTSGRLLLDAEYERVVQRADAALSSEAP